MDTDQMLQEMEDYWWRMAAHHRLIRIDEGRTGMCTFFVLRDLHDVRRFHARSIWTVPQDYPDGTVIYIDKLMAKIFDRNLLRAIERAVTDRFPQWEQAVWHRPGQDWDRRYTYYNRRALHANL